MHLAEIIVLIIGAVLFTVSFFMSDKSNEKASLDEEEERKIIRELLEKEMDSAKDKIEEATQECVDENRDRMERALDRITNEKMTAVDEYSNTVLEQIHKNHDEVMFLYDMLNNKHAQVKNTAAELTQITKSAKIAADSVQAAKQSITVDEVADNNTQVQPQSGLTNMSIINELEEAAKAEPSNQNSIFEELPMEKVGLEVLEINNGMAQPAKKKTTKPKGTKIPVADSGIDLMFASDSNSANNNDRILALHKEGKSNMAIAKELGLGIGEVKLVIDLFEGI